MKIIKISFRGNFNVFYQVTASSFQSGLEKNIMFINTVKNAKWKISF